MPWPDFRSGNPNDELETTYAIEAMDMGPIAVIGITFFMMVGGERKVVGVETVKLNLKKNPP